MLCSPLWLNSAEEALPKQLRPEPVVVTSLRLADGDASGHLLLFKRSTLDVNTLTSADGKPLYIFDLNGDYVLFWLDRSDLITHTEVLGATKTYSDDGRCLAITVDPEGRCFGIQVMRQALSPNAFDLQPTTYFPSEQIERRAAFAGPALGRHQDQTP